MDPRDTECESVDSTQTWPRSETSSTRGPKR
jgi:hypothetical protein